MFHETFHDDGLAHLSYLVGDGGAAAVIDPRRDCDTYIERALAHGAQITHVFETHRHEDFVSGAVELAARTGAEILHGAALDFDYGEPCREGDTFRFGDVEIEVLETPGHTFESLSLVLRDCSTGDAPLGVFTGDALFVGDVGRTDFYPDRAEEVAGLLYDSLHQKLLPLGDHVLLWPAHGAGSVCGSGMADRDWSTLGYERRHNPRLQLGRGAFIDAKVAEHHVKPPYFERMERMNLAGPPRVPDRPRPTPLSVSEFARHVDDGMVVVDIRSPEAFAGACLPDALALPLDMLPSYAGWFLPAQRRIGLVADHADDAIEATRQLARLGYDDVLGYLAGGMTAWEVSGRPYDRIRAVPVQTLARRGRPGDDYLLLDVRSDEEWESGHLPGATHAPLDALTEHLRALPDDRPVTTFCGSGRRAIIAASVLKRAGFDEVEDCLGSMAAVGAADEDITGALEI
ncbi:MAG: MBL fold metallo-hydrolase [Myxococcales bacterium]|nr:MBL fold metallo-hydrolase [Myxococcales bacterium]